MNTEVNKNTREYAKVISKQLKDYCKKGNSYLGLCSDRNKISVNMTAGTKYPFITLIQRGDEIGEKTREIALKTIYGDDYTSSQWLAGNVSRYMISMKPHQWEQFIINHRLQFSKFD